MDEFNITIPVTCPRQKLSTKEKGEKWGIDNLLYWESKLITSNKNIEADKVRMKKNANLYFNNILDPIDVARIVNPHNIKDFVVPADFKHYKIENPKIQTLKGEELKRRFEWKTYVSNRDAVSKKEQEKKNRFFQFITEKIQSSNFSEEEVTAEMQKLQEYLTYDWQDIREKTADQLLHYYMQYLDLKTQFSRAWENSLLYGDEIMSIDEHNLKPVVESCDPKTVFWLKSPESPYIDDSDCVIREYYLPLGQVIDYYYDYLTSKQISDLEAKLDRLGNYKQFTYNQYYTKDDNGFLIPTNNEQLNAGYLNPEYITASQFNFSGYFDEANNIRIVHTRWKSMRKVGVLTYFDEQGDSQEKFVDENYKIDKSLGETIRWIWITEAWEGTRIGEDIFVKIKPRSIQYRKLDNISACSLGYVGTRIDNCIFDLCKEYSIKYDAYMHRTEQAMIKAVGKIGILDLAMIPDDWNVDMWMHFATNMGWAIKDSFKEARKGAATGKLAGNMNSSSEVINLEQGQFVQQNMEMLAYLENQLDKLIGINQGRQGQQSPSAGLQLTREQNQASANITESYFAIHDNVKLRTLRMLLEVAKYCLKGKSESLQYVTSEFTNEIFNVDGDQINEAEFDLLVGDATNDAKTIDILQEAVKIALQTGQVDLIQLMDIFSTDSTAAIKRKVEKSVRAKQEQEQANAEQEQQLEREKMAHAAQLHQDDLADKQADRDLKKYEIDRGFEKAIQVAEIQAVATQYGSVDSDNDGIPDPMEIAANALKQQDIDSKRFTEQLKLDHDKKKHDKEVELKNKEMDLKKEIENKKIQAIKEQNKSQELIQKRQALLKEKEMANKLAVEKLKIKAKPKPSKK